MELRGSRFSGVSFTLLTDFHLEDFCCRWRTLQRSCFTSMKMSWALASNVGTPRNYFYTDILIYCIYKHMYIYVCIFTSIHPCIRTYIHAYLRTYTLTYASRWISTLTIIWGFVDLYLLICWVDWVDLGCTCRIPHLASPCFTHFYHSGHFGFFCDEHHVISPLGTLMRKARFVLKWGQVMCWKFTFLLGYNGQSQPSFKDKLIVSFTKEPYQNHIPNTLGIIAITDKERDPSSSIPCGSWVIPGAENQRGLLVY